MQSLELKIPPPIVAAFIAIAMWGISSIAPVLEIPMPYRSIVAIAIASIGIAISLAGTISFRQANTTVNPMKPESTSSLVSSGIYRFTRNPMYMGFLLVLIAWAVFLSSPFSLIGSLVFLLYINHFQIAPEERVLSKLFGSDYSTYQTQVRRWI
jgi:protein-S-isoprenylcysteine O-methyltransferase Ste14